MNNSRHTHGTPLHSRKTEDVQFDASFNLTVRDNHLGRF